MPASPGAEGLDVAGQFLFEGLGHAADRVDGPFEVATGSNGPSSRAAESNPRSKRSLDSARASASTSTPRHDLPPVLRRAEPSIHVVAADRDTGRR